VKNLLRRVDTVQLKLQGFLERTSQQEPALKQSQRWIRSVTWSLIGSTGLGMGWLAIAKTEEIAVVTGRLEPIGEVQEVRMPLGGVTDAVVVKEGEAVRAGQVLIKLNNDSTSGRLVGLMQSTELKKEQISQKNQELSRYLELNNSQQSNLIKRMNLQEEVVKRMERLKRVGAVGELQYLQERNRLEELRGQLELTRVDRQRQQSIIVQQLQQIRSELAQITSQMNDENVNLRYQELRSPVSGMVFDLKPKGRGFVAQTSEPVLKIVPHNRLQAVVEIPSRQIGFVRVGQNAEISIDSYSANDFGVIKGSVKRVASDALAPDATKGEQEYRYPGVISLDKQKLQLRDGRLLPLQAGMSLQAHIKLRSVSYLQLLLGGFKDRSDALRKI